jgi:hypothetical protein
MSDIVERLLLLAAVDNCQASIEAADEITRLRAALEKISNVKPRWGSESEEMYAIARAALTSQEPKDDQ